MHRLGPQVGESPPTTAALFGLALGDLCFVVARSQLCGQFDPSGIRFAKHGAIGPFPDGDASVRCLSVTTSEGVRRYPIPVVTQPRVGARNEPLAVPVRRWWTRLSSAHILIFSAAALAFIANLAILRPSELPPSVAVASVDLLPGTVFDPSRHVRFVPLATDDEVQEQFVHEAGVDALDGHVLTARISEGAPLTYDGLVRSRVDGRRIMSIPIDVERAAGGALVSGDRIDIVAVESGSARYVAHAIEVVATPENSTRGFSASSGFHLVVAVDAPTGLDIAAALDTGTLHVIRSTGSPLVTDG